MVLSYLTIIFYTLGAMYGASVQAMLDAVDVSSTKNIVIGFIACIGALMFLPTVYFCYCGRAARRAAQYESRGHITTTPELRQRLRNIFFPRKPRVGNMQHRMELMTGPDAQRLGMCVVTAKGPLPLPVADRLPAGEIGSKREPLALPTRGVAGAPLAAENTAALMAQEDFENGLPIVNPLDVPVPVPRGRLPPLVAHRSRPLAQSTEGVSDDGTQGAASTVAQLERSALPSPRRAPMPLVQPRMKYINRDGAK